jgi:hypothetical protein
MSDEPLVPPPEPSPSAPPPPERKLTPPGARRVEPNPDAPKLRKKTEERIGPADEKSARGYDAIERAGELVDAFKKQIQDGVVTVEIDVGESAVHILRKI